MSRACICNDTIYIQQGQKRKKIFYPQPKLTSNTRENKSKKLTTHDQHRLVSLSWPVISCLHKLLLTVVEYCSGLPDMVGKLYPTLYRCQPDRKQPSAKRRFDMRKIFRYHMVICRSNDSWNILLTKKDKEACKLNLQNI